MTQNQELKALAALTTDESLARVSNIPQILEALEVKALARMTQLLDHGSTEKIRLEAAKDLLDRGSRTSKVMKVQATSLHIDATQAKELAAQVALARRVREEFGQQVQGGWDRIPKESAEVSGDADAA